MARVDFALQAQAEKGAAAALTRWDWAALHAPTAPERLVKSWGLGLPAATRLVAFERRQRPSPPRAE